MINLTYRNHKMTLTDNVLSGDTYPIKDAIKAYMGGKWDGMLKVWIVDVDKINDLINRGAMHISNQTQTQSKTNNGLCPRCHTYCYGDCTASSH
jgi:hypothetical protein